MQDGNDESDFSDTEEPKRPRDRQIDSAKKVILERYLGSGTNVFYARQIEIWLEKEFFHWITKRALNELAEEQAISSDVVQLQHHRAHFYYPLRHRYPRRQIRQIIGMIAEFSEPGFTRAVGHHGEMLVESGFARTGFRIEEQKVRQVGGKRWIETNHDLDFLAERDGIRYGVEVKNQLGYIDQTEFQKKLLMCSFFGIRPMFVCRAMPKNYIFEVVKQGGFALLTDNQNYPLLADELARRVRETLQLPVAVIQRFPDTALNRAVAMVLPQEIRRHGEGDGREGDDEGEAQEIAQPEGDHAPIDLFERHFGQKRL